MTRRSTFPKILYQYGSLNLSFQMLVVWLNLYITFVCVYVFFQILSTFNNGKSFSFRFLFSSCFLLLWKHWQNKLGGRKDLFGLCSYGAVHHWGKSSQESRGKNWRRDHRGLLTFLWLAQLPFYIGQTHLPRHGTAMVGCPCLYKLAIKKNPMGQSDGDNSSAEGTSFQVTLFCVRSSSIPNNTQVFPFTQTCCAPGSLWPPGSLQRVMLWHLLPSMVRRSGDQRNGPP